MFDIKWIREHPTEFDNGMLRRKLEPKSALLIALDKKRREVEARAQELQENRNKLSKKIGIAKAKGEDVDKIITEVSRTKTAQARAEANVRAKTEELIAEMSIIPNLPSDIVPDGLNESDNREERRWGKIPNFDFSVKEHFELGETLGLMDFDLAAKMSGARFVLLSGALARLERALASFMLDLHTAEHDLIEINPPALVRDNALYGTGQLPKFGQDLFKTEQGLWMIPTAEVPLTNIVADSILDANELPHRMAALTWCFRSEAGSSGKDTRGMIRQHQFSKVEMVTISIPEDSDKELERMTSCAEEVLKRLDLPYRVVTLCSGDLGFGARHTYDLEVWLPGQNRYREISSCSNCGDFQARRMKARYRTENEKSTRFVHTLNGSGLAVGRTLVAVLENYQQKDGSVIVPVALRPYMGGLEIITANG